MSDYKFTFAHAKEGFDSHIQNSIRGYPELLDDIIKYSRYFIESGSSIVDIGCSTGKLLKLIIEESPYKKDANFIGIEIEKEFYKGYDRDTSLYPSLNYFRGSVEDFIFPSSKLVLSIFTLQFIRTAARAKIIKSIYEALEPGGAFIFSEKTVSLSPKLQEMRTFSYYDYKQKFFTPEEILLKEKELRHLLIPTTVDDLIQMCCKAGFSLMNIDRFWQNHGFVGFIALK